MYLCGTLNLMKTLTHAEYLAWQALTGMSEYELEEVDTICTSLINLGMSAETARGKALSCFRAARREKGEAV